MDKDSIRAIRFGLNGRIDLHNPAIRAEIVSAWETEPAFTPELAGFDERYLDKYSPTDLTGEIDPGFPFTRMIKRRKAVRFFGDIQGGAEPRLVYDFHPSISVKNIAKLFLWADTMADAFRPEAGTLTIVPVMPVVNATNYMDHERFSKGSVLLGGTYYQRGPLLGMHTWLGQHFVDLIGKDNLFAIPDAKVIDTSWGGVKIILGGFDKPWEIDFDTLIDTWLTSMNYLWQFGVFCEQKVNPRYLETSKGFPVLIKRGVNVTIPRMDGKLAEYRLSKHQTW